MPYDITRRPFGSDPFREMVPLRTMMDRLLENAFAPLALGESGMGAAGSFGMDVEEDDDNFYISCQLPGVDPNDVNIQVHDNVITISGETHRRTPEGRRSVMQETSYGRFQRQISLSSPVDAAKAEANYQDGVLEIKVPKTEASKPRTIQVRGAGGQARQAEVQVESRQGSSQQAGGAPGGQQRETAGSPAAQQGEATARRGRRS